MIHKAVAGKMIKTIILASLALIFCASAKASQDKDALTQLLKSEKDATKLVDDLRSRQQTAVGY